MTTQSTERVRESIKPYLAFALKFPSLMTDTSAQEFAEAAKSAVAAEIVSKKQEGKGSGLVGAALNRGVIVQLFKKWVLSDDKTKVGCSVYHVIIPAAILRLYSTLRGQ